MRNVFVTGAGIGSRWGRFKGSLIEMMAESSLKSMEDANFPEIDAVFVSNMGAGRINNQTAVGSSLIDYLNLFPAVGCTVENGAASGATAVRMAYMAIASGLHDCILVTGGEKMRVASGSVITDFIATMAHPEAEYPHGITFPSLGGMLARLYFDKYGLTNEDLALVAVKNHKNGMKNPYAHLKESISVEMLLMGSNNLKKNPFIADPLRRYDICPISDGSASIILSSADHFNNESKNSLIRLCGTGQGMDTHAVHERSDPTFLTAVKTACDKALGMANITRDKIDLIELHDAFTILELAEAEAAGFFPRGSAHIATREGITQIEGSLPINPSGGLKARGHPVGATGVAQICELVWQLREEAGPRQVPNNPQHGLAVNLGGFGNNVVATIVSRVDR